MSGTAAIDLKSLIANRRPGWSLPQPFYTAPTIFSEDVRRVYRTEWLFAGHISRIPRQGDYFTYAVEHDSIIIIRGSNGGVHAHFNVCRHRGSQLCTEASGHAPKLVCPYHQWVYGHDGALLAARSLPEDVPKQNFGLKPAHVRVLEGFIFISLAEKPSDFSEVERGFAPLFKPHGFPGAKICLSHSYDVKSNWKLIVENSRECYHCHIGHPEYCRIMSRPQAADSSKNTAFNQERMAHYQKCGLSIQGVEGVNYHASRYPFGKPGYVSESLDGKAVAPLMGTLTEADAGVLGAVLFPNFMFEASGDYAVSFRFTPIHATLTQVQTDWYVRGDAVEGRDYELSRVTDFWKTTGAQDWKLCEDNQAGVNSSRYEPGPYSIDEEQGVERFVKWYLNKMT
jgi:phenylpropionate dioxygenase-like ring-hydroxylating dioxygenase large terminal subunit